MKHLKTLFKKLSILSVIGTILLVGTIIFASRFSSDLKGYFLEPDPTSAVKSIYIPEGYVVPSKTLTMPIKLKTDVALQKISFEVTYPTTVIPLNTGAVINPIFTGFLSTSIDPITKITSFSAELTNSISASDNAYDFATFTVKVGAAGTNPSFNIQNVHINEIEG